MRRGRCRRSCRSPKKRMGREAMQCGVLRKSESVVARGDRCRRAGLYSAGSLTFQRAGGVMTPDETVTVKGSPVRSLQKFIEAELTPQQREEVLRALPGDYGARLRT